jgi:hypothetical protein
MGCIVEYLFGLKEEHLRVFYSLDLKASSLLCMDLPDEKLTTFIHGALPRALSKGDRPGILGLIPHKHRSPISIGHQRDYFLNIRLFDKF